MNRGQYRTKNRAFTENELEMLKRKMDGMKLDVMTTANQAGQSHSTVRNILNGNRVAPRTIEQVKWWIKCPFPAKFTW